VLTLVSGTGYALGTPTSATVTLYDTTSPTVSISPTAVTVPGSTSNRTITFTVSLSGSSPNPASVAINTVNGTAVAGTDFKALSTTLSFAPGVVSQTVTVTIVGRKTGKVNKSFTVVVSSPVGAAIGTSTSTVTITGTSAQVAAAVATAGGAAAPLSSAQLQPVVAAAERDWATTGVAPGRFDFVHFVITDQLPLGEIGYTDGDTIYLAATAAGFGWYTGPSGSFDASGLALPGSPADGHMDLLTVVLHELGHTLGLPDGCACGSYADLMQASLPAGVERLLPAAAPPLALDPTAAQQVAPISAGPLTAIGAGDRPTISGGTVGPLSLAIWRPVLAWILPGAGASPDDARCWRSFRAEVCLFAPHSSSERSGSASGSTLPARVARS
jgi:hypothetical protein